MLKAPTVKRGVVRTKWVIHASTWRVKETRLLLVPTLYINFFNLQTLGSSIFCSFSKYILQSKFIVEIILPGEWLILSSEPFPRIC